MPVMLKDIVYPINSSLLPGKKILLNVESLKINDGEFVGIIDAGNGGCSVLGKIFCGLIKTDFGSVSGKKPAGKHEAVSVFLDMECERAVSEKSVEREVCRQLKCLKMNREETIMAAKEALEFVGMDYEKIKDKSPYELSSGDRRMTVFASAFAMQPDFLVLNEPMNGMDGLWCSNLMKLLDRINKKGTAVLLICADTSRISEYADRIIIMKNGSIAADSSAKNVFSEYYGLVHLGVPVPEVKKCCQMLRENGMDMPNNIILYEQFFDRLKILMWRKNK